MVVDKRSEAVLQAVAENPAESLPFALQFIEVLEPFLGECKQDPATGAWNVIPSIGKTTHSRPTQSGSTKSDVWSGYEDNDHDDDEVW